VPHGFSQKLPEQQLFASPKDLVKLAEYNAEERLLQEVVEECLVQVVIVTRAWKLKGQEMVEPWPSICLDLSSALMRKDTEKAVAVLKNMLIKVLSKKW
jgi:serine palmitoyltransferase